MFGKILIANRGEIACRVAKTARRMGIKTVAVYSEADAKARHVDMADEAYLIGPPPAKESYLLIETILDVAKRSGAQAVHPGYGFLSENAEFAEACAKAGIVFIGPPVQAIRAMGSKSASKALMEKFKVPLVPGYHGEAQDVATLEAAARKIGYPVLIKASAGGGGKGMKIVEKPEDLTAQIASAQREARSSFGDDKLLIEKYLIDPRHIEIQVFADQHGKIVSLFERDCSIQRRHQKVVEEAPGPGIDDKRRKSMGATACEAARAVGYVGAGTVEFIADKNEFYFMEMNTRLQVEHPVTEMITGQDLVEWQFRVASGEPLPLSQEQLSIRGHAMEARVYAEDPDRNFLPSIGKLTHLRAPAEDAHVRVDTGVREGDTISMHYDPMIAKLIVWDHDREAAARRMSDALAAYEVVGVQTNIAFLKRVVDQPAFRAGEVHTGFIPKYADKVLPPLGDAPRTALIAAVQRVLADFETATATNVAIGDDRQSPWNTTHAWRLNGVGYYDLTLRDRERVLPIRVYPRRDGFRIDLDGSSDVRARTDARGHLRLEVDGAVSTAAVVRTGNHLTVLADGVAYTLEFVTRGAEADSDAAPDGHLTAPMPAKIVQVLTKPGAAVKRGSALMILEAMKMEHTILAPSDGVVEAVKYGVGDTVTEGAELITFERKAVP